MKSGFSKRITVPGAVLVALSLFCAHGQEKKAEVQSSTGVVQHTNSSSKSFKQSGLNDLEKNIFGSFKNFGEDSGADALSNRKLARPALPSKEAKESLDRRKNWAFMTPEELVLGRSTVESYKLDGTDKSDETKLLSPMERWLLNKDKPQTEQKKGVRTDSRFQGKNSLSPVGGPDEMDKQQDDSLEGLPQAVRETQRALRANKEKDKKENTSEHHGFGFFADVFALERKPSLEEQKLERERLDAYRKSLGLDPLPTFESPFAKQLEQAKDPYRLTASGMMNLPPASSSTAQGTPSAATGFKASPFSDPASKAANSSSLSPAPPRLDPPKTVLPPNPTFAAPRRVF